MKARLQLAREQIPTFRRSVGALDERLPPGPASLRRAVWAGLQDSVPWAAVLSIHARVHGTGPDTWEDPSLVQLWGPRFSVYVVGASDLAVFSLGRLPGDGEGRRRADDLAGRLHAFLDGRKMTYAKLGTRSVYDSKGNLVATRYTSVSATGGVIAPGKTSKYQAVVFIDPEVDYREFTSEVIVRGYVKAPVSSPSSSPSAMEWPEYGDSPPVAAPSLLGRSFARVLADPELDDAPDQGRGQWPL